MARRLQYFLIAAALFAAPVYGQTDDPADAAVAPVDAPERAEKQRRMEHLPHEKREELRRNYRRWKSMSPEERRLMRQLHERRRQIMRRELEQASQELGVDLNAREHRELKERYLRARRELERRLRREMEERREAELQKIVQELRQPVLQEKP